ncbi:MAG TPA: hypothetical protein VMP86_01355 [Candidatus Binatia bacterium]|nr:hypothetical protein [Candidatus Binatia bacterium]
MTSRPNLHPRSRVLRDALRRAQSIGPFSLPLVAGLGTGLIASFVVDGLLYERVGTPWRQFADATAFSVVAAPVWLLVQRPSVRHAHEVLTWLNGWETERWQAELGRRLPSLPRATPQLLEVLPDTMGLRPLRTELLAATGELDEARERLDLLPRDTPWQRFEHAALDEWIAWWSDDDARIAAMEAAVPDIEDPERRLVAHAMVAAARARRAAVRGEDAVGPLAALRGDLGSRPDRYAFPYRTGVILSIVMIGLIASLAVTIAAAIIR